MNGTAGLSSAQIPMLYHMILKSNGQSSRHSSRIGSLRRLHALIQAIHLLRRKDFTVIFNYLSTALRVLNTMNDPRSLILAQTCRRSSPNHNPAFLDLVLLNILKNPLFSHGLSISASRQFHVPAATVFVPNRPTVLSLSDVLGEKVSYGRCLQGLKLKRRLA